jgi:hypothetical protein
MSKWGRTYTMSVQGRSGEFHKISFPITNIFDMDIRGGSGVNSAHFMLHNLDPAVRNDIQFDSAIDIDGKVVIKRSVTFNAGYTSEGALPVVFQGNIHKAFYYRESGTGNVVTDIVVMDGLDAIQRSMVAFSRGAPWAPRDQAATLANLFNPYGVTLGATGTLFDGFTGSRGVMHLGATWDVLGKMAVAYNGCVSMYQEKVYLIGENDALLVPGALPQLDATTGLLGTPRRSGWTIDADMLFEPRVHLWQLMKLKSIVNPTFNSTRRVDAISHKGIISGSKDGGAITSLSLYLSPKGFNQVPLQ